MSETKDLPTLGVLGVATGICLKDGGFAEIHETLNHLYPGIMTLGCAAIAETAAEEIMRQHPEILELGACDKSNWERFAAAGLNRFGATMPISGPHGSGGLDMIAKARGEA